MNKSDQHLSVKAGGTDMDLSKIKADVTLDLRGVSCPLPPLKTIKALGRMQPGEILEVLGTSSVGKRSSPWVAQTFGNQFLGSVNGESYYRFFVKKT
jgi:tRNA 2-thiouridine synthesizing protein A